MDNTCTGTLEIHFPNISEPMMRLYCEKVGIKFEDSMINWEHPVKDMSVFENFIPWYEDLLASTSFKPPSSVDKKVTLIGGNLKYILLLIY